VETAVHQVGAPQSSSSVSWVREHVARLVCKRPYGGLGIDRAATGRLASDAVNGATGDGWHRMKQTAGCRRAMQSLGNPGNAACQLWFDSRDSPCHLGKSLSDCRSDCLGYDGQKLLGRQANQGKELFRSLLFAFRLRGHVGQMLHHAIGIDLPHRTHFIFPLPFAFQLAFGFPFAFQLMQGLQLMRKCRHGVAPYVFLGFRAGILHHEDPPQPNG
jgi:hypothetical protein